MYLRFKKHHPVELALRSVVLIIFGGVLFSIHQHGINEICKTNLQIFGIYMDLLGDLLAFQTFATRTYLKYSPEI